MERAELKARKKRTERVSVQARHYDRAMRKRSGDSGAQNRVAQRYRMAREALSRIDEAALYIADTTSGCPGKDRRAMMNLGHALYGAWRRRAGDDVMERMAQVAGKRLANGYHRKAVLDVLARCWVLLVGEFPRTDIERVRDLAESYGQGSRVKGGIVSKAKKKSGPKLRRAPRGRDPLAKMTDDETVVERVARASAADKLRAAIAPFLPVERQCIIGRLARRMSFAQIARELSITRGDVDEILTRARSQVQTFTNYFNADWLWPDGNPAR